MAKAKGTKKATTTKKAMKRQVTRPRDDRLSRHVRLLLDPCHADLGPTAYRGRDGFINRFNTFFSIGPDPAISCGMFFYHPRLNRVYNRGVALFNDDVGPISWYGSFGSPGPGATYLTANADEARVISSCVQAYYSGTELDRQGIVYQGVIPARALGNATGNSVAALSQLLQKRERTPDSTVETKWLPTPSSENYERTDITVNEFGDDNVIVVLWSGFAASKLIFNMRVVSNVEWLPAPNIGVMTPSPSSPDVPAGLERVRSALATFGNWWVETSHTAAAAYNTARRIGNSTRALVNMVAPATPLLLTM